MVIFGHCSSKRLNESAIRKENLLKTSDTRLEEKIGKTSHQLGKRTVEKEPELEGKT